MRWLRLRAGWRCDGAAGSRDDREDLHVEWRESGVEIPATAVVSGYGRELIERALAYQLDARTHYELTGDGVHCTITVPLADGE